MKSVPAYPESQASVSSTNFAVFSGGIARFSAASLISRFKTDSECSASVVHLKRDLTLYVFVIGAAVFAKFFMKPL